MNGSDVGTSGDPVSVGAEADPSEFSARQRTTLYVLCALTGIAEGFGLQSGGMAAPKFAAEFHLLPDFVGGIFLLTSLGLALGASVGGWAGDRIGSGRVMNMAVALFGLASIGSARSSTGHELALMRGLMGLGLGGALPNLIALLTYVGRPETASRRVTLSIAAVSGGALLVGLTMVFGGAAVGWRFLFNLGGWPSLVLAAALPFLLPAVRIRRAGHAGQTSAQAEKWRALFGRGRIATTLLLWFCFFATAAASYLLINWAPTFLLRAGLNQHQVGIAMIGLAIGGAAGPALLGSLLRPTRTRLVVCLAYLGTISGMCLMLIAPKTVFFLSLGIAYTGFFTAGTQGLLFGIVGPFYPPSARGTGVGSAVALGRIGSGAGPAVAGMMLAAGLGQDRVIAAAIPMIVLVIFCLLWLLRRPQAS